MPQTRLVVIGASLGGLSALRQIVRSLPPSFPAPICVVQHVGAHKSILPALLTSSGEVPAVHPSDGEALKSGCIFIAPPDHHMRVEGETVKLLRGPKEHHTRPAIDPLFRSAALSYGKRTIGIVLTGLLDDGTPGMQAIRAYGGTCIVQDPAEAEAPGMPLNVIKHVDVDYCVRLNEIAPLLCRLVDESMDDSDGAMITPNLTTHEDDLSLGRGDAMEHLIAIGNPSTFTCPDCSGSLWQVTGTAPQRFLCHTGHAFTLESLRRTQSLATDEALWSAIRALQEKRMLVLAAAKAASVEGDLAKATELANAARQLDNNAQNLRTLVEEVDEAF